MGRCQWLLVVANIFVLICNITSPNEATEAGEYMVLSGDGSQLLEPQKRIGDGEDTRSYLKNMILGKKVRTGGDHVFAEIVDSEVVMTPGIESGITGETSGHSEWRTLKKKNRNIQVPFRAGDLGKHFEAAVQNVMKKMETEFHVTQKMIESYKGSGGKSSIEGIVAGDYPRMCPSEMVFETDKEDFKEQEKGKEGYGFHIKFYFRTEKFRKQLKRSDYWRSVADKIGKYEPVKHYVSYQSFTADCSFFRMEVKLVTHV